MDPDRTILDQDIAQAFNLLAVLLVFVIAYFSYLVPTVSELVNREPAGVSDADKTPVKAAIRGGRLVVLAYLVVTAAVVVLLVPLTGRVLAVVGKAEPQFPTVEWGLLMVDAFLALLFGTGVLLILRLGSRLREI